MGEDQNKVRVDIKGGEADVEDDDGDAVHKLVSSSCHIVDINQFHMSLQLMFNMEGGMGWNTLWVWPKLHMYVLHVFVVTVTSISQQLLLERDGNLKDAADGERVYVGGALASWVTE